MLDPATTVTFVNGEFYKKDLNNFGPTAGFAWDLTQGRQDRRARRLLADVRQRRDHDGRPGCVARQRRPEQRRDAEQPVHDASAAGVPVIRRRRRSSPTRTLADQMARRAHSGVLWGIDPDIQSPHVHQVSFGIQRELPWATRGRSAVRRHIRPRHLARHRLQPGAASARTSWPTSTARGRTGTLRSRRVWRTARCSTRPSPGSQPLTVLPSFGTALLTNSTVDQQSPDEPGRRARRLLHDQPRARRARDLHAEPAIYASQGLSNGGFSDYNSLQLELRRQFRSGFFAQVNYTLSQTRRPTRRAPAQNRFEAFMDNNRPELNTGRSVFNVTHVINANAIYELPFGRGKKWLHSDGVLDALAGGWQVASIVALAERVADQHLLRPRHVQPRRPLELRDDPIGCNTAFSTLSVDEIKGMLGVFKQPDGKIYWIDPKVVDTTTGRAVGADNLANSAGFAGQVFFNPAAGDVGNLPIIAFDGPTQFRVDLALSKRVRLTDRHRIEVKGEAFNLTNTPSFFRGDMDINGTTFGRLTSVNVGSRVIQLSLRYQF